MTGQDRFNGKRALVTGGASGIGLATAARLASEGAHVAVVDIDGAKAKRVCAELRPSGAAVPIGADCADEQSVAAAVAEAVAALGGLDIVVASAGIELLDEDRKVTELDYPVWRRLLANNLDSQFLIGKHALPHLVAAGSGAMVCVGSNCATLGLAPGEPAYSASKGGIHALMRVMAVDYIAAGVRVNLVVPGFVDTPMNEPLATDPEALRGWVDQLPIRRPGTAAEIAAAICWLASDDASYCVGTMVVVDGGQSAV